MTTYIGFDEAVGGPVPAIETELRWQGQGRLPSGQQQFNVLFFGEKSSAGTATAGEVLGPLEIDDIETYAGAGSPIHCMAAAFAAYQRGGIRPKSSLYILPIAEEATGTAPAQTLTFANNATDDGLWIFGVGGHRVNVGVRDGDTPTEQGDAFVAALDALPWSQKPPLTASNAAGTVTLTWTVKGEDGNTCGLETIQDPGVTTTATWGASAMAGGAGVQSANLTTALAAMAGFEDAACVVTSWRDDATLELIIDQINTDANAQNMIPRYLFWADDDTVSNLVTAAAGLDSDDSQRVVTNGLYGTTTWNGELAALSAAVVNSEPHLGRSVDGLRLPYVDAPATADKFTGSELRTLLEGGVTPWYVHHNQSEVGCCRMVANRNDFGVVDFAKIRVADYVRSACNARLTANLDRASIVDNDAYQPAADHVVTPDSVAAIIRSVLKECEALALITNVDDLWAQFVNERNGTELRQATPLQAVDQLHNLMTRLDVLM